MARPPAILAIDQGTTSSRALVLDLEGNVASLAQTPFAQHFPAEGWVEHNPEDIWRTTETVARAAFEEAEAGGLEVAAVGITNQRETALIWERASGAAIHNAIVWQDRRTAPVTDALKAEGAEKEITARTGLLADPYFSATKFDWLLDHVPGARARAEAGELAFGTVDSFLVWRLTGGAAHVTDATNASRTSLFNIHDNKWDSELLRLFNVPEAGLPQVRDCIAAFGTTPAPLFGRPLPVLGIAGDQQAATMGLRCFEPGEVKSTYGTGCFTVLNTGRDALSSKARLLTTIAYRLDGETTYALEGSIFMAGALIQWLRDGLGLLQNAEESETLAASVKSTGGAVIVPAHTGLGAPYWDPHARGLIAGLTRATGRAEIARAALEAVAFQTHDLFEAMAEDGVSPARLKVDGGMSANGFFLRFLSDLLGVPLEAPPADELKRLGLTETTAIGAAMLAAKGAGLISELADFPPPWSAPAVFKPVMTEAARGAHLARWREAVARTRLRPCETRAQAAKR